MAVAPAAANDRTTSIVIRAGKSDSPSHTLARQFAGAIAAALNGAYTLDVQESQGSVQNVIDAAEPTAAPNLVFTAGPDVVQAAERHAKPFHRNWRYGTIRALFPMPGQTLHWVVRKDSKIRTLDDLAGHSFISGAKGGVSERVTTAVFQALGIDRAVQIMAIDAPAAPAALAARQVSGFALAAPYPDPAILALARKVPIRLLGLKQPTLRRIVAADDSTMIETVPGGTYPGMRRAVTTLAVAAGVYTTLKMSPLTAYRITKAFWSEHAQLIKRHPAWAAASLARLAILRIRLHPGALRYYRERGVNVPKRLR